MKENQIVLSTDEGEITLFVIEQTRVNGVDYLLVSDTEEEEADCWILKDTSAADDAEAVYEEVTDDEELDALLSVFESLLEDTVFQTKEE